MREKIAKWYRQGLWTEKMVLQAAEKGLLTRAEAKAITEENGHDAQ